MAAAAGSVVDADEREVGSLPAAVPLARRGAGWATVRIFCSSTFLDHLEERRALERAVVPELEVWGRERCVFVVLIDLVWGVLADTRPSDTVRTCFGQLAECERANGAPYILYLGGSRYGWAPAAADLDAPLRDSLGWVEGASITAMEVLAGGLRARRNPNALFCLRDEAFARGVPQALRRPDFEEADATADAKQRALREAIVAHAAPAQVLRHSPTYGDPASWAPFSAQVAGALKRLIGAQYPPVATHPPGSLAGLRLQHDLAAATLADSAVQRAALLASLRAAATGGAHQLLVVAAESGRGKSSALAQLARALRQEGAAVITHFVSKGSNELSVLARRVASEVQLTLGDVVDERKLPTDPLEACSLARATLLRRSGDDGPGAATPPPAAASPRPAAAPSSAPPPLYVIVDAINELRGDVERKLDWLPDASELAGMRAVVIVSCVPGPELGVLCERAGLDARAAQSGAGAAATVPAGPAVLLDVEPLNADDRRAVCAALLARHGKKFSAGQMEAFVAHPGAGSPLWQSMALGRLRQRARFETVSSLIAELPPALDELMQAVLADAEALAGRAVVQGLLLGCSLARQGLLEHEARHVLPLLARAVAGAAAGASAADVSGADGAALAAAEAALSVEESGARLLQWTELRTALDPILLHAPAGAPVVFVPSHGVVRAAILARYAGGAAEEGAFRALAAFFDGGHASVTPARRAVEACWAHETLRDSAALARTLNSDEVLRHLWFCDGDAGRWELSQLWGVVGKLDREARVAAGAGASKPDGPADSDSEAVKDDNDVAVAELARRGIALAEQVVVDGASGAASLNFDAFALVRATGELLQMLRRSADAVPFLRAVEARLLAAAAGDSAVVQAALAWTRSALGHGVRTAGDHLAATQCFESAVEGFERAGFAQDRALVVVLVELGRTYQDLFDETEDRAVIDRAVAVLKRARAVHAALQAAGEAQPPGVGAGKGGDFALIGRLLSPHLGADVATSYASSLDALQDEADVLNALANVHYSLKDFDAALALYRSAHMLLQRALGDSHPYTMRRGLWGVAIVQKAQGALAESARSFHRILAVFTRFKGARHPDAADMHYNLGQVFEDMGDFRLAEVHLREALAIYAHVLGPRHKDVAWTWHDLGGVAEAGGNLAVALEAFGNAASIRAERLGEDEPRTLASRAAVERVSAAMHAAAEGAAASPSPAAHGTAADET